MVVLEIWEVVAIAATAVVLIALAAWLGWTGARRARRSAPHRTDDKLASLRSEMDSTQDRSRMLEERFERFERTHAEVRDAFDRMREDVESRLVRASSHDLAHRELQEQIAEIRKQHQVMMDRDERQERRLLELQEHLNDMRSEVLAIRGDGNNKVRR